MRLLVHSRILHVCSDFYLEGREIGGNSVETATAPQFGILASFIKSNYFPTLMLLPS
jgi:hypothetical protein